MLSLESKAQAKRIPPKKSVQSAIERNSGTFFPGPNGWEIEYRLAEYTFAFGFTEYEYEIAQS